MNIELLTAEAASQASPLLDETIACLQELYEEQDKRKSVVSDKFDITEHLQYIDMPTYSELISSDRALCRLASRLFSCIESEVTLKKKRLTITENCSEISFEINGEPKVFYIKKAWEGPIKEAIGLEFNNLLTDAPQRYLCSSEIVITEKMFEPLYPETVYRLRKLPEYVFAYGAWEAFTSILRLTDRKIKNVRWNGKQLANIDFGLVFYRGEPVFDSRFAVSRDDEMYWRGQAYAINFVLTGIHRNQDKIKELLLNLNSAFCRNLPSHRPPAVPLKIILSTLKRMAIRDRKEPVEVDIRKEKKDKGLLRPSKECLDGLSGVNGHLGSAFLKADGKILVKKSRPGYRFEDICAPVVMIIEKALILVSMAGLGKCNFVQVNTKRGILFAMWAIEDDVIISAIFDIDVVVGQAKTEMLKAAERFIPLYEEIYGLVHRPVVQPDVVARFVPSNRYSIVQMLKLAQVTSNDVVYDLGCGDGVALITAVSEFNVKKAIGVEIRPKVAALARKRVAKTDFGKQITIIEGDLFETSLNNADVVLIYLTKRGNKKLLNFLKNGLKKGARVVSQSFPIGDLKSDQTYKDQYCELYLYKICNNCFGWKDVSG